MIPNSNSPATSNNNDGSVGGGNGGGGGSNGGSSAGSLKKGPWTAAEDAILMDYVKKHGEGNWNAVQKNSGLSRCGKSCRLRWANHLRPNLKKGSFSPEEERLILELHSKLGNKWARMAAQLPGRTDNEIKNYWNTRVKRRQRAGLPLYPQDIQKQAAAYQLNQINQPRSFQSAPPQASVQHPSSQQQQQPSKHNFGSPLPLLDPVNFPVTAPLLGHHPAPYLPPPFHRYKRFRDNNCIGFSLPFSANPPQQQNQPPPLYSQGLNTQLLPASSFQLSSSNFDFNPPPPILGITPFDSDNSSPFSMKLELPSDQQLSQPADAAAALGSINDFKMISPLGRGSSSGLLDALFQESQAIVEVEDSRRDELLEEKCGLDGVSVSKAPPSGSIFDNNTTPPPLASASQWDDSSSAHSSPALQIKKEGNDGMNSLEDLSFLDFMPTVRVPELYSDSGEMSNGQSSGVTDDEIRLDWPNWNNITSTC